MYVVLTSIVPLSHVPRNRYNEHHRNMFFTRVQESIYRLYTHVRSHVWDYTDHTRIPTHAMQPLLALMACRSTTPCTTWFSLRMPKAKAVRGLNIMCSKRERYAKSCGDRYRIQSKDTNRKMQRDSKCEMRYVPGHVLCIMLNCS